MLRKSLPNFQLQIQNIKSMYSWLSSKPVPVAFLFPLFLADVDKNYRNEIEIDKK